MLTEKKRTRLVKKIAKKAKKLRAIGYTMEMDYVGGGDLPKNYKFKFFNGGDLLWFAQEENIEVLYNKILKEFTKILECQDILNRK